MNKKIIIVGGVAGGASTAARLRRLDENAEIIMLEKGEYISFANCGLPYYIGETIDDRGKLIVQTVEKMSNKFNLDIRNFNEVIEIDREKKKVRVKNLKTNNEYDEAYDVLVLSPGAASMGKEVTMFFTFWGLNILKNQNKPKVSKDAMEKMFDVMLPAHPGKLPLSQMNMMGMGPAMIKQIMKKHNVDSLETLIKNAIDMGVKVVACSMSMELMGIKKEEFIDGVEIGGVASYLGATEDSGLNLFI